MTALSGESRRPGGSGRRGRRRPAGLVAVLTAAAIATAAACGTTSAELPDDARPVPSAPAVTDRAAAPADPRPAGPPAGPDTGEVCADGRPVRASLPPVGPLPSPGRFRPGSTMAAIYDGGNGYLDVGITTDVPPAGSMNWRTLEIEGFDVDIAAQIATALFGPAGTDRMKFHAVTTSERGMLIMDDADPAHPDADTATDSASGLDLVIATYTITCERKADILFSGVYFESSFKLLIPKNAGFHSIDDFAGLTVCSTQESTSVEKLREAAAGAPAATPSRPPIPGLTVIELPRAADCLVAVQQGRADAAATDDVVLAGMADQDEYLEVAPSAFGRAFGTDSATLDEPYGVALWRSGNQAQDDEFVRFVNGVLKNMMLNGEWDRIYNLWFGALGARDSPLARNPSWPETVAAGAVPSQREHAPAASARHPPR
ncbi:transporter substrate-binding domain-containing protein [Parafrankia sp. FMc6]|uniref:transporter substrate-binding domain-containing protein n=1 Tax=Parafrankia soli TaxID=2599596 RepID=UPI0034D48991